MAKKQKMLLQMELFDEISINNLSPNQYYFLCSMYNSTSPLLINTHLEHRILLEEGWVTNDNKLEAKSVALIDKLERVYTLSKKRTSTQLMGNTFKANIAKYREMFPNKKLPSGKAARSAPKNLENAFRWFFENYTYNWDSVFKATIQYVNDQQKKGDKYMRTSQFFIRKNNMSDLADLCDALQSGGYTEEKKAHSIKVV